MSAQLKITRRDIIEHRRMAAKKWHDQAWHDFFRTPKHEAIAYAEDSRQLGDSYKEIAKAAMRYADMMAE